MYRLTDGKINIMTCIVIMAVILGVAICGMQQDTTASTSCVDNKTMNGTEIAEVSATDGDLQLYAKNAVLIDGETEIFYMKRMQTRTDRMQVQQKYLHAYLPWNVGTWRIRWQFHHMLQSSRK